MNKEIQLDQKTLYDLKKWAKYGHLISGIIHNLNTPLMGISGRLELIELKNPDLKGLDQINKQLEHINKTLQSLAYLADKDIVDRVLDVDISDLLEKIDSLLSANMTYKHQMNIEKKFTSIRKTINVSVFYNEIYNLILYLISISNQEDTLEIKNEDNYVLLKLIKEEDNDVYEIDSIIFNENIKEDIELLESINIQVDYEVTLEEIEIRLTIL